MCMVPDPSRSVRLLIPPDRQTIPTRNGADDDRPGPEREQMSQMTVRGEEVGWLLRSRAQAYAIVGLSLVLLAGSVLFFTIEPATEYEVSLVNGLPLPLWACFYVVLVGGVVTLVVSALTESRYWRHGLALVIANYALFLFLPKARGYRFFGQGNADGFVHIGYVKTLVESGSLPATWYPGEHVLLSELTMLGIPLEGVTYVSALLFTAVYIVGVGALVGSLYRRRWAYVAGLAAGIPLIFGRFHLTNHPSMNSFMLIPVLLVFFERYRRDKDNRYLPLIVLLLLTLVYFHPMTTLFAVVILAVVSVYTRVHAVLTGDQVATVSSRLAAVLLVLLFPWLSNFDQTRSELRKALLADRGSPAAAEIQRTATVEFTPLQLFGKFVDLYGGVTLYLVAGGLVGLVAVRALLRQNLQFGMGLSATQFGVGALVGATLLLGSFVVRGRIRAARYVLLFAAILVGIALLYSVSRRNVRLAVILTVVIVATAGLNANTVYKPNQHTTYAEYDGTEFLVTNQELGLPVHAMETRHGVERFVLGSDHPRVYPPGFERSNDIPRNLGYDSQDSTAAGTFGQGYIVTKTHDMEQHTAAYFTEAQQEFLYRYGPEDIERLQQDRTVNKIYTNGGFSGWLVVPPPEP